MLGQHFVISRFVSHANFALSNTDLDAKNFDIKQIFLDTPDCPGPQAHHEEQTDGRISQTIGWIQNK